MRPEPDATRMVEHFSAMPASGATVGKLTLPKKAKRQLKRMGIDPEKRE